MNSHKYGGGAPAPNWNAPHFEDQSNKHPDHITARFKVYSDFPQYSCGQCARQAPALSQFVLIAGGGAVRACRDCYLTLIAGDIRDAARAYLWGEVRLAGKEGAR